MVLAAVALALYFAYKAALSSQSLGICCIVTLGMAGFDLLFNAPAAALSRYLYLLTFRRTLPRPPAGGCAGTAPQVDA